MLASSKLVLDMERADRFRNRGRVEIGMQSVCGLDIRDAVVVIQLSSPPASYLGHTFTRHQRSVSKCATPPSCIASARLDAWALTRAGAAVGYSPFVPDLFQAMKRPGAIA